MTTTYELLAEFAQSAGTVYFFLLFIGTLVYALWPRESRALCGRGPHAAAGGSSGGRDLAVDRFLAR